MRIFPEGERMAQAYWSSLRDSRLRHSRSGADCRWLEAWILHQGPRPEGAVVSARGEDNSNEEGVRTCSAI